MKNLLKFPILIAAVLSPQVCLAVGSAELYTSKSYGYGRFETRARFAPGDGVVSSFFMWKDGSEKAGTFWNELDFEKLGGDCHVQTNPIFGNPSTDHSKQHALQLDLCGAYHTYTYEWTPEAIVWLVDGTEIRRETGATAQAYADNASAGMQIHFNVWPGDATFGGNFSPSILPVHQYVDWVQYSTYQDGAFTLAWREDFDAGTLPDGWLTGSWASPKNHSTHDPENVNFIDGYAVLSLTADDALGPAGAMPSGSGGAGPVTGSGGSSGALAVAGSNSAAGAVAIGGGPTSAGSSNAAAGSGVATSGAPSSAGSSNGAAASASDNGCSIGRAPRSSAHWWALGIAAMALLSRRVRRRDATG
ncbi:MAG TPA: family 16 glycosylhydrolase [Polyangiaceae bacterium]|nr:family 16 glycosylhydrolase [Polyangiaceae bacterium]